MVASPVWSLISDRLYTSAVVVYTLAFMAYAAELAATRARQPAPVTAHGGVLRPDGPTGRPLRERVGRVAVALTLLGAGLHGGAALTRGVATLRPPWGNMYEFISVICLAAVVGWLVVLRRHPVRAVGVFVLLPLLVLLFLGGTALYAVAAPVVPALQSYWLSIHVAAAALASGVLLLSGTLSAAWLFRMRMGGADAGAGVLPAPAVLDRIAYRCAVFGFPIWTFAVITGAIWAEGAWGRYWGWDPKETTAFVAWVLYAAYLHARATAGWKTRRAAWINVAALIVMVFNLFFINLVIAGLHSYAGV